ncbi:DUF3883 domain-containing protein [Fibrobacter sp.]|uniref:DUF3883 domain-containing protein n=1 Tax=Fibrobacter sp. TaxID=35828 RepID=UPI0025BA0307|nr:DUF3883 domain-containing protein [Fibrobacter sp.]MBR3070688.1 DUF3883 domain-containing protein [Fibrobacter sp.]
MMKKSQPPKAKKAVAVKKIAVNSSVAKKVKKSSENSDADERLKKLKERAETIANEMINVAYEYANKWGTTSDIGFVTTYGHTDQSDSVLNKVELEASLKTQKENLIDTIRNNGVVRQGNITHGTRFNLNTDEIENTIIEIFVRFMKRLGIAVADKNKVKVLKNVFRRCRESWYIDSSRKGGGVSSNIAGVAAFSYANLKPAYKDGIEGWKNLFKKLNEAYESTESENEESLDELDDDFFEIENDSEDIPDVDGAKNSTGSENEESSKRFDDKEENADADISAFVSKYTPPETEMKKEIEKIAVEIASSYYMENGYTVTSVEHENCGWDLTVFRARDDKELHIEVKGTSRNDFHFFLSKNEYDKMMNDPKWRLFVAKNVLEDPDPECIVKCRQNVEKLFDLIPFCIEGIWKDE